MKELEDYKWFPAALRNYQTSFIGFVALKFRVYNAFVQYLNTLFLSQQSMTDLCSGSGEPALSIFKKANCFRKLYLTDKYPAQLLFKDKRIIYESQSTDVLKMQFNKGICYTMFNAFHHFSDKEKLELVQKIQASGARGFIVEILEPTVICLLKVLALTTVGCLLFTPFILPFSFKRIFFTYIIPINIITISYDGVVSVMKSRTVKQYKRLFSDSETGVKIFRLNNCMSSLTVIEIKPKHESAGHILEF